MSNNKIEGQKKDGPEPEKYKGPTLEEEITKTALDNIEKEKKAQQNKRAKKERKDELSGKNSKGGAGKGGGGGENADEDDNMTDKEKAVMDAINMAINAVTTVLNLLPGVNIPKLSREVPSKGAMDQGVEAEQKHKEEKEPSNAKVLMEALSGLRSSDPGDRLEGYNAMRGLVADKSQQLDEMMELYSDQESFNSMPEEAQIEFLKEFREKAQDYANVEQTLMKSLDKMSSVMEEQKLEGNELPSVKDDIEHMRDENHDRNMELYGSKNPTSATILDKVDQDLEDRGVTVTEEPESKQHNEINQELDQEKEQAATMEADGASMASEQKSSGPSMSR